MKILVVGGGGREHAIVWRLINNPAGEARKIYCAPGNAGIAQIAECVPISATDTETLLDFAVREKIDYTIIGMDEPLALGIVNAFNGKGLRVFGPVREAAKLEWSKSFAKAFMRKYGIPTASCEVFNEYGTALSYIKNAGKWPVVIKADGLAVGKGVYICKDAAEAGKALSELMLDKKFGGSGAEVVIEEFLEGPETTLLAFSDGKTVVPMLSSMDYKKALNGDKGPNTGGMGAICPSPYYTAELQDLIYKNIVLPTQNGLAAENIEFKGILYFGLMFTKNGPYVIEYNARFGDPETQAVLPLLKTDLLEICFACSNGTLDKVKIKWHNDMNAVCVVVASGGYPGEFGRGYPVNGLDKINENAGNIMIFHAGTQKSNEGEGLLTNGGRVLGVTATGQNQEEAARRAYAAVSNITFQNMHNRTDIGEITSDKSLVNNL
ncbi:MAG: phosphoribosylamine--glycine ligase [Defluviitaleaceae bacterium]|nr:phosphoribosylamine--glycine ligase [Defluviitaleaceae bacterium]MCL2835875.1 phosphoribosylamine--glycine ligase [Defluviitaleaceae bacterium]